MEKLDQMSAASGEIVHRSRMLRLFWWTLLALVVITALGGSVAWGIHRFWPRKISYSPTVSTPAPVWINSGLTLQSPTGYLLAEIGTYHDELTAYLYFEYVRSLKAVDIPRVLLTAREPHGGTVYQVYLVLDNDLLTAIPYLAELQAQRFIGSFRLQQANQYRLRIGKAQTQLFLAAYERPVQLKLRTEPRSELTSNVARFILFKAKTDRRVRLRLQPSPPDLSGGEARDLAADILAVADFYDLPLDFFLGIGAMENNYMNVRGDLKHTIWKKRAEPGDIVIRRKGNRVLVLNYSIGVWQITRETLRYAHSLFLKDHRDYSNLPERLRPPRKLNLEAVDSHVLTTYAGLLLRDLLDRFNGNVTEAVGAYNGGITNPNMRYAEGVQLVATYAQRVLAAAASVNGQAIAQASFVFSSRPDRP